MTQIFIILVLMSIFVVPPCSLYAQEIPEPSSQEEIIEDKKLSEEEAEELIAKAENPITKKIALSFVNKLSLFRGPDDKI